MVIPDLPAVEEGPLDGFASGGKVIGGGKDAVFSGGEENVPGLLPAIVADVDLDGLDVETVNDDAEVKADGNSADDAPVVRFVNKMLLDAIKKGSV